MAAVSSILAAAAVIGTIAQVRSAEEARDQANDQRKRNEIQANALQEEAKAKVKEEEIQSANQSKLDEQKRRKRALSAKSGGRQSTILTSPLGVGGGSTGASTLGDAPIAGASGTAQPTSGKSLLGM